MSVAAPVPIPAPSGDSVGRVRAELLGQALKSPSLLIGFVVVGFWVVCAFFGERIAPADPLFQGDDILSRPKDIWSFDPGLVGRLGTDQLGRDVFSRVLVGASDVLRVAPAATLLGTVLGTALGLLLGYKRGWIDEIASRIIDTMLALPLVILAVTAIAAFGTSTRTLIIVIGLGFTPIIARTVRAAVLGEAQLDYVQAARLRSDNSLYIMFVEILPNVLGPVIVEATVRLGYAIFAVAGLTFLGLGVQPPSPDWALQVSDNYALLNAVEEDGFWWTVIPPSLAIASLVIGVNLIADGIASVVDR
jgi:peptide/nickel transport system permease protein